MTRKKLYASGWPFVQRFAFSWVALAIGYGVGFGVERVVRGLSIYGGDTKAILFWFGAFAVLGWLVFALPVLVISPWRKWFRRTGWSGMVGGLVGAGLFINTAAIFSGGRILMEPRGWLGIGMFGGYAFVIGFVATASYVWLCSKFVRGMLDT